MDGKEVLEAGAKAGLTIAQSSLLGAFSILCLTIAVFCVWLTYKTQNLRVADLNKMTDRMEALVKQQAEYNTKTVRALEKLNEAEKGQTTAVAQVQSTMNSVLSGLMGMGRGG